MYFLCALFFYPTAWAGSTVRIPSETPVYEAPTTSAHVLFYLHKEEQVEVNPAVDSLEFLQVQAKRAGRVRSGFVKDEDLKSTSARPWSARTWGFGLGGEYTSLSQKGRNFETDDQVQYTTTDYRSSTSSPFLSVQEGTERFWRLTVAKKQTHYLADAKTNLNGPPTQAIELQHSFLSGLLQRAWSPFPLKNFYFGLGAEVARATSIQLTLGGKTLSTSSSDLPTYLGLQLFMGGQVHLEDSFSAFAELRFEEVLNQSPPINMIEATVGVLYWP